MKFINYELIHLYLLCDLTTPLLEGSRLALSSPCGCGHHGRRHCGHTGACWCRCRRCLGTLAHVVAVASSLLEGLGHRCCRLRPWAVSIVAIVRGLCGRVVVAAQGICRIVAIVWGLETQVVVMRGLAV